jgi:hypothetical protein
MAHRAKLYTYTEILHHLKTAKSSSQTICISVAENLSIIFSTSANNTRYTVAGIHISNENKQKRFRVVTQELISQLTRKQFYCLLTAVRFAQEDFETLLDKLYKIYDYQSDKLVKQCIKDYNKANKTQDEFEEIEFIKHCLAKKLNVRSLQESLAKIYKTEITSKNHYDRQDQLTVLLDFCIEHDLKAKKIKYGVFFNSGYYLAVNYTYSQKTKDKHEFLHSYKRLNNFIKSNHKFHYVSEHLSQKTLLAMKLNILIGVAPIHSLLDTKIEDICDDYISVGGKKYTLSEEAKDVIKQLAGRKYLLEKEDGSRVKGATVFTVIIAELDLEHHSLRAIIFYMLEAISDSYTARKIQYRDRRYREKNTSKSIKEVLDLFAKKLAF